MKRYILTTMVVLAGCGVERSGRGLTDEEFIATMAELRRAAQEADTDTARFEELRRGILERAGVTEAELRAFVEAPERDLRELAELWDSVGARLAQPGDSVR